MSSKLAALLLIPVLSLLGFAPGQKPVSDSGPRLDADGEPLPPGAVFRFGSTRFRTDGPIMSAAISPDGRILATQCPGNLVLWDAATGKRLHTIKDLGTRINIPFPGQVAFSPDGTKLFAATSDVELAGRRAPHGEVGVVVDVSSGQTVALLHGWKAFVTNGCFLEGGKQLVTISQCTGVEPHEVIRFWDSRSGQLVRSQRAEQAHGAFDANGRRMVQAARDGAASAVLFELPSAQELFQWTLPARLQAYTLSNDGKLLAGQVHEGPLCVWRLREDKKTAERVLEDANAGHPDMSYPLAFSPDGKVLFRSAPDSQIRRWDCVTGLELAAFASGSDRTRSFLFTPDLKAVYCANADGVIRRLDTKSGVEQPLPEGFTVGLRVAPSPNGRFVAVGDSAGRLELWDAATRKRISTLSAAGGGVSRLAWSPTGELLAVCRDAANVQLWSLTTRTVSKTFALRELPPGARGGSSASLQFSADGRILLVGAHGLHIWDAQRGERLWDLENSDGRAALAPDGKSFVSSHWGHELQLRELPSGDVRLVVATGSNDPARPGLRQISALAYSPDGRILATNHADTYIRLRDGDSLREFGRLAGVTGFVQAIQFSPDSKWVACVGVGDEVSVWELASGKKMLEFEGPSAWTNDVHFSPDSRMLYTNAGAAALLWSLRPGQVYPVREDSKGAWEALTTEDAAQALKIIWGFVEAPENAAQVLRAKLPPAKQGPDRERFNQLVTELDSDAFAKREAATRVLAELRPFPLAPLRAALKRSASPEARRRLEKLIESDRPLPTPDERRLLRAVQVLELAGTPECRTLLETWAGGAAGALLTEEAKAALGRLKER